MNDFAGKTCPYCRTKINSGEEIKVCPACEIPHHIDCWEENRGCTTFGCAEQCYEPQGTNISDVCIKCGAPLGDGQNFCSKCGARKGAASVNVCSKCRAQLQVGQWFCPRCGQRTGLAADTSVAIRVRQYNFAANKRRSR